MSGEIQLQFCLFDPSNPSASPDQIYQKFKAIIRAGEDEDDITPITSGDNDEADKDDTLYEEADDPTKPETVEKRRRRLRIARLKRKSIAVRAYEFSGAKDGVSGIIFMEINKVLDLPPERNGENLQPHSYSPGQASVLSA